jgi:hypothetical protein
VTSLSVPLNVLLHADLNGLNVPQINVSGLYGGVVTGKAIGGTLIPVLQSELRTPMNDFDPLMPVKQNRWRNGTTICQTSLNPKQPLG